jgi:putative nucleotidyltransferase with HDIG domain
MLDAAEVCDPGLLAHCRRVDAWSSAIAHEMKLSVNDRELLSEASRLHHYPPEMLSEPTVERMLADLHLQAAGKTRDDADTSELRALLEAVQSRGSQVVSVRAHRLAHILEIANYFDEQLELAPFESDRMDQIFDRAFEGGDKTLFDPAIISVLRNLRRMRKSDLFALIPRLPVYPAAANRALQLLADPEVSFRHLENITGADPVMAGGLLEVANSATYSARVRVTTVSRALLQIGTETARQLLTALAVRPLFTSPRMRPLWKHSLEAAQVAQRIAVLSPRIDPQEAFLLGLVHDIGRLSVTLMPEDVHEACERLIARGCQSILAELIVFGFDHAESGAEVLKVWNFPPEHIEAIRSHHQPERSESELASLLYLTEFWTASEEDLPSNARLLAATTRLGLTLSDLEAANLSEATALTTLEV